MFTGKIVPERRSLPARPSKLLPSSLFQALSTIVQKIILTARQGPVIRLLGRPKFGTALAPTLPGGATFASGSRMFPRFLLKWEALP